MKEDILILAHSLETLESNPTEEQMCQEILGLCLWAMERMEDYASIPSFVSLYQGLLELSPLAEDRLGKTKLAVRCQREMVPLIKTAQKDLLQRVPIQVYYTDQAQQQGLFLREGVHKTAIPFRKGIVLPTEEQIISGLQILVMGDGEEIPSELEEILDFAFTHQELIQHTLQFDSWNSFEYDRLYLSGKLHSLSVRPEVRIFIAGSSYAMVGLLESAMPRPAVNAAVNAQDPYYSLLCAKKAIALRPEIDTILLPLAYYFFFSDLADHPSDYSLSILSFVDIPVFQDRHGYAGDLKVRSMGELPNPVIDAMCERTELQKQGEDLMAEKLSRLPYFNDTYKKRPPGGMLSYCFQEKTDEQNQKVGAIRAYSHNQNYHMGHGRKNLALLDEFLTQMDREKRRVILFVPPVTDFYRDAVSREMQDSYYQLVLPLVKQHPSCVFVDLFDSPQFDRSDFQDYDHLNQKGAEKLSKLLAKYCGQGEEI